MTIDVQALAGLLSERLEVKSVNLTPLNVRCAWPVFKATAHGRPSMFVKVVDRPAAEQTLSFLSSMQGVPFFPRAVLKEPVPFADCVVLCLEWRAVRCVNAEDMSDAQLDSFADGVRAMSKALSGYRGPVVLPDEDSPVRQYSALADYARRHPLVAWLLRPLLAVPEPFRTYAGRRLSVIHGDFQPLNYGFDGDRFSSVFDFDALTNGLPCEDAAYAFTERMRRSELSRAARRRLAELFLRLVKRSRWQRLEWRIAVNHARLRIASRRLESHPDSPFIAFDIWRRDRQLSRLAAVLEQEHA